MFTTQIFIRTRINRSIQNGKTLYRVGMKINSHSAVREFNDTFQ